MDINSQKNSYISSYASIIVKDRLYISDKKYNVLIEVDMNNKLARLCGVFEGRCTHRYVVSSGNFLWWIPESNKANTIDIYNIENMTFSSIEIPVEKKYNENCRFSGVFMDSNDSSIFWCMPCCASDILKINTLDKRVELIPIDDLIDGNVIFCSSAKRENDFYICEKNRAYVYKYNINEGFKCLYNNTAINYVMNKLIIYDDYIYLIPRKLCNPWVRINMEGLCEKIIPFGINDESDVFSEVQFENTIISMPYKGNRLYRFDINQESFFEDHINIKGLNVFDYWLAYYDDQKAVFSPVECCVPIVLMNSNGTYEEIKINSKNRDLEVLLAMLGINSKEWK